MLVHKVFRTLLFVDGNGGELKACLHHLIWALYRRCALHLEGNHNDAFKNGGMTHAEVQQCCKLFRSLAFASTVDDFVALLQNSDLLNKELSLELRTLFFYRLSLLPLCSWTNAFIGSDVTLWGRTTSQFSESFNNLLLKIRKFPITALFQYAQKWTADNFVKRRELVRANLQLQGPTPSILAYFNANLVLRTICALCN